MRVLKILAAILFAGVLALMAVAYFMSDPRPEGQAGPEADALARSMEAAVRKDAWDKTGAVRWSFFEAHDYVWDRKRGVVEVRWGETRALLRTSDGTGRVWSEDGELTDKEAEEPLRTAYEYFINDSYWLNPVVKFFDPGVERELVTLEDGREALLVTYTTGGVTPGDAYLWIPGPDGLPEAWRMWVKIIPIGGVENSWEGWTELRTGAKISTQHESAGKLTTFITDLDGAEDLDALGMSPGLFDPLFQD